MKLTRLAVLIAVDVDETSGGARIEADQRQYTDSLLACQLDSLAQKLL